ncbi:MAG: hypothetical protein ACYC0E_16155 [Acidimicrobiales bacterium]
MKGWRRSTRARLQALSSRLEHLEEAARYLQMEVRTRRLVIVDDEGRERVVGEVRRDVAELHVDVPRRRGDGHTSVLLFAAPVDRIMGFGPGIGLQLWVDGEAVERLEVWQDEQP